MNPLYPSIPPAGRSWLCARRRRWIVDRQCVSYGIIFGRVFVPQQPPRNTPFICGSTHVVSCKEDNGIWTLTLSTCRDLVLPQLSGFMALQLPFKTPCSPRQRAAGGAQGGGDGSGRLLHLQRTGAHHPHAHPAAPPLRHGAAPIRVPEARPHLHRRRHAAQVQCLLAQYLTQCLYVRDTLSSVVLFRNSDRVGAYFFIFQP